MTKLLALFNPFAGVSIPSSRKVARERSGPTRVWQPTATTTVRSSRVASAHRLGVLTHITAYALVVMNVALTVSYFIGVNAYAAKGYEIKKMQNHIFRLEEQYKKLTIKTSEVGSIAKIQDDPALTGFVPVGTAEFVQSAQYSQR